MTKRLRDSDLKKCNVILDVKNSSVLKCRQFQINGEPVVEPDYQKLLDYFHAQYPEQIDILLELVKKPVEA